MTHFIARDGKLHCTSMPAELEFCWDDRQYLDVDARDHWLGIAVFFLGLITTLVILGWLAWSLVE